ncbi:glycosyl hydrolase family 28-related protein [Anianabacter salinae]|uniref:glycosyl hydrolase family 28-related protein n=1 Tax=Anianabacter salinae TaxID=2851023 RepID=UPI00225E1DAB|nr:glycosyl hydrolase family 28-related protein [Anianabacter salinae]MBV0911012.1 glycoside hydrolase family 55 protein [Anianabacter salinae]
MTNTPGTVMPSPFADGLHLWSRADGTAGSATYANAADAALVPADEDFGGCLELQKTQTTQKLRHMCQTPMRTGYYLRITVRAKAISGPMPSIRIAGWAGRGNDIHVGGLVETAGSVALTSYGEEVTLTAVIGSGQRDGVDLVWGQVPEYGYFGIDLTGPNGGVVRIDDIEIADITGEYARELLDWVDVRDYGAVGDGVTDDSAAFEAADSDGQGRRVLVPAGTYYLGTNVTFESEVRFEGQVVMPVDRILSLRRNFYLDAYAAAFGSEVTGFKKAFQALLNFTDHEELNLNGRQIQVDAPIDMQAAVANKTSFATRRVITNGTLNAEASASWATSVVTASATYSTSSAGKLQNVTNIANIAVGSLVEGNGVGREVYVKAVNVAAGEVTLTQQLYAPAATQSYTFRRFRYMLDFSGFDSLSKLVISNVNLQCAGECSAILLPQDGSLFGLNECDITKPKDRGITSAGGACQGMAIDNCRFSSNESPLTVADRTSIAFNVNSNDLKLRGSWFQHFRHTAVLGGTGHMIVGNHWFQGDDATSGLRRAGIVFTGKNLKSVVTGNYVDNSSIEMTNEHDATPDLGVEFSFGGLTITGNIFTCNGAASWFRWIVVKPYGAGHFIQGMSVIGNTFRTINGNIARAEGIDDSIAGLDLGRMRNIVFSGNTFNGVDQTCFNPVTLEFNQNTNQSNWVLNVGAYLPFEGFSRTVEAVTTQGVIRNAAGATVWAMPYATTRVGANENQVQLSWPEACRGTVQITARMDTPI